MKRCLRMPHGSMPRPTSVFRANSMVLAESVISNWYTGFPTLILFGRRFFIPAHPDLASMTQLAAPGMRPKLLKPQLPKLPITRQSGFQKWLSPDCPENGPTKRSPLMTIGRRTSMRHFMFWSQLKNMRIVFSLNLYRNVIYRRNSLRDNYLLNSRTESFIEACGIKAAHA